MSKKLSGPKVGQSLSQKLAQKYGLELEVGSRYQYRPAELLGSETTDLSNEWRVSYYVWSKQQEQLVRRRKRVSGKTLAQRKRLALQYINEINMLLENGAYIDPVQALEKNSTFPLAVALEEFLKVKQKTLKRQSYTTYEKWCRYFVEFLEHYKYTYLKLGEFGHAHADNMRRFALEHQGMGNKTYNNYKAFVSGFFIYCKPIYQLSRNPISETLTSLPTISSKHHRAYNEAQVLEYKKLCEEMQEPQLWLFCQMIYYTFCRPNEEVRKMQVGDVKVDHIVVEGENSKTGHRTVMIPLALELVFNQMKLRDYPAHYYIFSHDGVPGPTLLGRTWMYDRHTKIMKKMGLYKTGYDLYGFKHTGAIALYKATKDLMLIKTQCGHSDISQTVEYLRDLGVFHYSKEIHKFPPI